LAVIPFVNFCHFQNGVSKRRKKYQKVSKSIIRPFQLPSGFRRKARPLALRLAENSGFRHYAQNRTKIFRPVFGPETVGFWMLYQPLTKIAGSLVIE